MKLHCANKTWRELFFNKTKYPLTLEGSFEGGLLLDRILREHQDQLSKDHEEPGNTRFGHRPAMYMHNPAGQCSLSHFTTRNQSTSIDYRLLTTLSALAGRGVEKLKIAHSVSARRTELHFFGARQTSTVGGKNTDHRPGTLSSFAGNNAKPLTLAKCLDDRATENENSRGLGGEKDKGYRRLVHAKQKGPIPLRQIGREGSRYLIAGIFHK